MNALFLHRVFGYRGVILFPWLARVFDRCDGRSNTLPPLIRSTKTSQSNIHEIRAKTVTYYQVLIDNRDMPHIRAQTEAVTFLGNQERDRNLYAIPGLDYVAHEDVIPYTSTERTPIEHELFDKFLLHDSEATPNFVPREYLKSWQERHHHWLELSDVAKDVTHQIRVTVIPFYMGSRSAHGVTVHWWRYSIRIENLNPDEPVTLRERHWRIFSLSGTLETVRGKGVVGHEPRLSKEYPAFQYSSHISLSAPSGHMWGTFKMERDDGTFIEVRIPPFNLESLKGVAWITGRSTRKWYRQLPPEKRSIFIQHLDRHKYKYMGIVGAIGAAFSIHYYTHLETSPITGRRRFMLMNAEQLTIMSDLEKEKIATMFSNQMLPENSKQTQLVARVAKQIIGANMDIDSIRNIKWSVRVVTGDIYATRGILETMTNQDQLAIILAHELSHALLCHSTTNEQVPMTDMSSGDTASQSSKLTMDGTSNLSSDTPTIEPTTAIKTDNDDTAVEDSSALDDSAQPNYLSSMSFFDLVETIFVKKEDIKPIENVEQLSNNAKEETMTTETISEGIPFLSDTHEPNSETLMNNTLEGIGTTLD
ncbi:unnamed protein product [Rotaria sp. Silwood1]|nr:unnamed protein product [Rotaria sp. Silwood1]